jgi:hypothetical protein
MRVLRLDVDGSVDLVDLEPLEVFSAFGRPRDSVTPHLKVGVDTIIATDADTHGALAAPSRAYPENEAATWLLIRSRGDLDGLTIVGSVFVVGIDDDNRLAGTPPHVIETLTALGYRVPPEMETIP